MFLFRAQSYEVSQSIKQIKTIFLKILKYAGLYAYKMHCAVDKFAPA